MDVTKQCGQYTFKKVTQTPTVKYDENEYAVSFILQVYVWLNSTTPNNWLSYAVSLGTRSPQMLEWVNLKTNRWQIGVAALNYQ